jgi:EAL domain-containing protein (putative c-di-GMP-specific phosphodiesterase class I)
VPGLLYAQQAVRDILSFQARGLDVAIAIEGLGSDYPSLFDTSALPSDIFKIDRGFVLKLDELESGPTSRIYD